MRDDPNMIDIHQLLIRITLIQMGILLGRLMQSTDGNIIINLLETFSYNFYTTNLD